jgi:hypothetical protein
MGWSRENPAFGRRSWSGSLLARLGGELGSWESQAEAQGCRFDGSGHSGPLALYSVDRAFYARLTSIPDPWGSATDAAGEPDVSGPASLCDRHASQLGAEPWQPRGAAVRPDATRRSFG